MEYPQPSRWAMMSIQIISALGLLAIGLYIFVTVVTSRSEIAISTCPVGTCPVNFVTGVKDCSTNEYSVATAICLPAGGCGEQMPCALQPDGSTDCVSGLCALDSEGVPSECNCSSYRFCPDRVSTYFVSHTFGSGVGDIAAPLSRRYYSQHAVYNDILGTPRWDPALSSGFSSVQSFCSLDTSSLSTVDNKVCLSGQLASLGNGNWACVGSNTNCPVGQRLALNGSTISCEIGSIPNFWLS